MSRLEGVYMTDKIQYPVIINGEDRKDMVWFFYIQLGSDAEALSEEEKGEIWDKLIKMAKTDVPDVTQDWITYNPLTEEDAEFVAHEVSCIEENTYDAGNFLRNLVIQVPVTEQQRDAFREKLRQVISI